MHYANEQNKMRCLKVITISLHTEFYQFLTSGSLNITRGAIITAFTCICRTKNMWETSYYNYLFNFKKKLLNERYEIL